MQLSHVVDALRRRVHGQKWTPTSEPTEDELLLRYIEQLEDRNKILEEKETLRGWEISDGNYR